MIDVLYSLVDANERFDRLILDPFYIQDLDMSIKPMSNDNSSIDNQILDRICEKILPRIYHQVEKLTVELHSMKRILPTINFPQLYSLSLVNFEEEILLQCLTDDSILRNLLLTQQITHLNIDIQDEESRETSEILSNLFALIVSLCKRLINLNFCQVLPERTLPMCVDNLLSTNCISSNLTELKINVTTFDDCLYLLDGRFDCLSTLIIYVFDISFTSSNMDNTKKLPKLKCFSLTSITYTLVYDSCIIPLLRRMINLEELILYLSLIRYNSTYVDGIQLFDQILIYMPQLNRFTFSINTWVQNENTIIDLSSNEDIQQSFIEKGYGPVASYVHTIPMKAINKAHIYSLPYQFENFLHLNNSFQGGIFTKVRYLMMNDTEPFEHQLFQRISQDFSFLKCLIIFNEQPQKNKQHSSTLIIFPHLIYLNLSSAHVDYAEQFLVEKNTHLPHLLTLHIKYESLLMITNNFTNNATRLKCSKLKSLNISEPFVRSENFHQYFPLL
ncbi:unnamed protein product [Rotaria sordida]|uniref:Uncharacterized protein n=1 Tax=Rotaria sordida TaxID=392033 RepID=A0A815CB08_9BILA|nr:unnamed protein product [Rotaria sordida]